MYESMYGHTYICINSRMCTEQKEKYKLAIAGIPKAIQLKKFGEENKPICKVLFKEFMKFINVGLLYAIGIYIIIY